MRLLGVLILPFIVTLIEKLISLNVTVIKGIVKTKPTIVNFIFLLSQASDDIFFLLLSHVSLL